MTSSVDLDELVSQIRSTTARTYLSEAVAAYRAGAQRAAITTAWIAVCVDLFEKISELAAQNEAAAVAEQKKIEDAIENKNIDGLLKIEREIVEVSKSKLGIISSEEASALSRLKEDRNKCAHPSFSETGEQFNPSQELARMHLVEAMQRLLLHPPVQGKSLISKLMTLVEQPSFPEDPEKALAYLSNKNYLGGAKPAVARNFAITLLRRAVVGQQALLVTTGFQIGAAMNAVSKLDATAFKDALKLKLPQMLSAEPDSSVRRLLIFMRHNPEVWDFLDSATRIRLTKLVEDMDVGDIAKYKASESCRASELKAALLKRMVSLSGTDRRKILSSVVSEMFLDLAIGQFLQSSSFDQAAANGREILIPYATLMSQPTLLRTLEGALANATSYGINQITNAGGMDGILEEFYQATKSKSGAHPEWKNFWTGLSAKQPSFTNLEQSLKADGVI